MKLQVKFIKGFVIPVAIATIISLIFAITMIFLYSYHSADENMKIKLVEQGKDLAAVDTLTVNTLMQKMVIKAKVILEMQINQYLSIAELVRNAPTLSSINLKGNHRSCLSLSLNYDVPDGEGNKTACWFINNQNQTLPTDITNPTPQEKIVTTLSHVLETSMAIFNVDQFFTSNFYFTFDKYNLVTYFPVDLFHRKKIFSMFEKFTNPLFCIDNKDGNHPTYFFYKCRAWYSQMAEILAIEPERTLFIISPYFKVSLHSLEITICMRFKDPISISSAQLCADFNSSIIFDTFDQLNNNFNGHFLITTVNYLFPFYFPKMTTQVSILPIAEYEFSESSSYFLEEFITFKINTTKVLIKDYIDSINTGSLDPLAMMRNIPDPNKNHYFMKNGEVYNYTIYPIIVKVNNTSNPYVHLASIVYIYQEKYFLDKLFATQVELEAKIIIVLVIWCFIAFILTTIINILIVIMAKFIVIPIKNVGLMLKGINIGGEDRLNYIELIMEKATEATVMPSKRNQSTNALANYNLNDNKGINNKCSNQNENSYLIQSDEATRLNNTDSIDSRKDATEASMRDLISFEFNEELLEYRPKEINSLVKVLLDLKKVLLLTSNSEENNNKEMIIDFSKSEHIFEDVKIQEGERICQSNIGNLSSSNRNYDLAIYHLALSLQDTQLSKYFSKAIIDELDTKGTVLRLLERSFNKNTLMKDNQSTQQTKQNCTLNHISKLPQKEINKLINKRYNKLIYIYYRFFALLSKSHRKAQDLEGLYLHTKYHSVYYFQKILVQYVHLCHSSNDLIKIGEAILEYIHFLIKFKLNHRDSYIFNESYKDVYCDLFENVTYGDIHKIKTAVFAKIIQWFDLFDHYMKFIKENTMLDSDESIIEQYSKNDKSKAGFLFKVIVQKGFYLKGKLAFICKHYRDAIELFIEASRSDLLVSDGMIRVKALNHLNKITMKLIIKEEKYQYLLYNKKVNAKSKEFNWSHTENQSILQNFKSAIDESLLVLNALREKDVLILIDSYSLQDDSDQRNIKEQIEIIISSYLSMTDRIALFYVDVIEKIICPMTLKRDLNINELYSNLKKMNLKGSHHSVNVFDDLVASEVSSRNQKALSYCISYLSAKEIEKNEMFLIWFTNGFSGDNLLNENDFFSKMKKYVNISLFIVGRIDSEAILEINKLLPLLYNQNSQCVLIDDIKRIKALLFSKQYITNDFEFPNEIYESHMN